MKRFFASGFLFIALVAWSIPATAKDAGFGDVVKLIESYYHVKHQSIPFLARAGIKTATTVARISGGQRRQIAEAGSVKVAYFEDQDFTTNSNHAGFKSLMNSLLSGNWSPLVQTTSTQGEGQTHVYLRESGDKFNVLVVTIEAHEACVVQVTVSPQTLAQLMRTPDEMGETITVDATTHDQ
jgi:hypothetical protein